MNSTGRDAVADGEPSVPGALSVHMSGLKRVGARPTLGNYLARLWGVRHFIAYEAKVSVGVENREHLLGNIWLVLTPLLNGATYFLIFGLLLGTSRGVENFLAYLTVGVFMFTFTSRTVMQGANSLTRKNNVVEAFNFPRIALPVSSVLKESLTYGITLVTMLLLILAVPPLEVISWRWLLLIPTVLLQLVLIMGLVLLFARIVSKVRDFSQILTFALRVWMYGSGVFYSFESIISHPGVLAVLQFNPMHQVLDISRKSLLYGVTPGWDQWLILAGWAVGLFVVGLLAFWRADESLGRDASR
ncbi:ABC transporter permease [Citricoccus sp. K5]|uniref:ABC transporter permease n=1 Tax=Citricoccus sp. K5 TaxID=2653135 RepID=UPI001359465A|nr:ABC transporter permease [Citricoccus sp. K5]